MSNINIENLGFDAQMDRDAMAVIAGGWGWSSVKKVYRKAKKVVGTASSYYDRGMYYAAGKAGWLVTKAPARGARLVGNYFRSVYRNARSGH